MSLPQTYGTPHVFGLLDITQDFITINTDGLEQTCGVDVKVLDQTGRVITVRKDDTIGSLSFSGVLKPSGTPPTAGGTYTFAGVSYIVDSCNNEGTNNGFRKFSVKATKYSQITTT